MTEDAQPNMLDEDSGDEDRDDGNDGEDASNAASTSTFLAKFCLKKRTLKDLCHQIKSEEQEEHGDDIGEFNSSEGGGNSENGANAEEASDAYRSDDDVNEQLLQQIQD